MIDSANRCRRCGASLSEEAAFQFQGRDGAIVKCRRCALLHRPMLGRSFRIALVVGTVLVAINQGDVLFHRPRDPALIWKVPLTYLVPFTVATWGALLNGRVGRSSRRSGA